MLAAVIKSILPKFEMKEYDTMTNQLTPQFIGFNAQTPFVAIIFYREDGSAFKRLCYDQEDIDFVVEQYVDQVGVFKNTTYIQVENTLNASKDVVIETINTQQKRIRATSIARINELVEAQAFSHNQVGGVSVEHLPYYDQCMVTVERKLERA